MKKKILKRGHSDYNDDYDSFLGKKGSGSKQKGSKKRLSIYDDYEEDEEDFSIHEKFKKRHK